MFHVRDNAAKSIVAISEAYATGSFSKRRVFIKVKLSRVIRGALPMKRSLIQLYKTWQRNFQVFTDVYKQVLS